MDASEKELQQLEAGLDEVARYIIITPTGWDISGWSKSDAVLIIEDFHEMLSERRKNELIEGRE